MTPEDAKSLRKEFPPHEVGKLPRLTCGACRNANGKVCGSHQKAKCQQCGGYMSTAHMHLDYVGHAETTDRLLQVDSAWTWEPLAFGADGLPVMDRNGGLWIRLTVCCVTRLGYGDAAGKTGPDAVKEAIGDGIRNAAMRFGVALDLWRKTDADHDQHNADQTVDVRRESAPKDAAIETDQAWLMDAKALIREASDADLLDEVRQFIGQGISELKCSSKDSTLLQTMFATRKSEVVK